MASFRALVERLLPWYDPALVERRNARTSRIARHSETARLRAVRVIAEYRRAEATERVIEEVPH